MSGNRTSSLSLALILAGFLALGFAYSVVNPLHEATDELRHYRFVRHISERGYLPIQGELACSTQAHHPPLFYALGAAASFWVDTGRDVCYEPPGNPFWAYRYWEVGRDNKNQYLHSPDEAFPWRGEALAAHLIRLVNLLLGAGVVALTWFIARAVWPDKPAIAAGSAAFVAFNPMFLYMSGAINNDVVAALSGAAVTLACVRLLADEGGLSRRWGVVLGLLYGLALLSKFNLAAAIIPIGATVTWVAWRKRQWRAWLIVVGLIVLMASLLAGWWFVRNQLLYGEPTGFERLTELWGARNPSESFRLALSELPYVWTSLWGRFGYGQIPLPNGFYLALYVVALIALIGYLVPIVRRRTDELRSVAAPLALLALNVLVFFGVVFNYLLVSPAGPMGRFFFPALPSLAVLLFFGLSGWEATGRRSPTAALALLTNLGMFAFSLIALAGYLAPAYARPSTFAAGADLPNASDVRFDTLVRLAGYEIGPGTLRPGEPLNLDLYWEVTGQPPGDYLLFVHLIDEETGAIVGQRDTHPGLGNFPTSQWRPGDRFVESLQLYVPDTAYTPARAAVMVGLYAPNAYRLGVSDGDGRGLGDAFQVGQVALEPATSEPGRAGDEPLPNPLDKNFENVARLVGYDYSDRRPQAGDVLRVRLFWDGEHPVIGGYAVRLELLDADGRVRSSYSQPLRVEPGGSAVAGTYDLYLDPALSPGVYGLRLAIENVETERRLNLLHPDGRWIDDHLMLSPIVIAE